MQKKVLIIGSGIAGISSSLKLKTYGIDSVLVDKGRFLGGRISSREVKNIDNIDYFFSWRTIFYC